jgi:hypothetical protein
MSDWESVPLINELVANATVSAASALTISSLATLNPSCMASVVAAVLRGARRRTGGSGLPNIDRQENIASQRVFYSTSLNLGLN